MKFGMRNLVIACASVVLALMLGAVTHGQTPGPTPGASQTGASTLQKSVAGEVTALDPDTKQITIKTSAGTSTKIMTDERTVFLGVPPTGRTLEQAVKIAFADVRLGDRVLVRGNQIIVMSQEALAAEQERERAEARRRALGGVITALNPRKEEIGVLVRTPGGSVRVTIVAAGNVRWLRYAPDSLKFEDARLSSFAELRVGDQLRARGERSADGTRFTPEEIISGALIRVGGAIIGVDAATRTLILKNEQTGKQFTVTVSEKTTLKRVPPELTAVLSQSVTSLITKTAGTSANQPAPGRAGGDSRNLQQLLASLPVIPFSDLRKGESALVFGSTGAEPKSVTAISLLGGDAELVKQLQQLPGPGNQQAQEMNPGLPGDVLGDGTTKVEKPKSRTDPP